MPFLWSTFNVHLPKCSLVSFAGQGGISTWAWGSIGRLTGQTLGEQSRTGPYRLGIGQVAWEHLSKSNWQQLCINEMDYHVILSDKKQLSPVYSVWIATVENGYELLLMVGGVMLDIDDMKQKRHNCNALAMELHLFFIKPLIWDRPFLMQWSRGFFVAHCQHQTGNINLSHCLGLNHEPFVQAF